MKNYLFCLIILICISCEYELKDDYYRDVDKYVDAPVAQVELNFATDTIFLNTPSYINFKIDAVNHEFHWVKFYINDVLCGTSESNSGLFEISPNYNNYTNGIYLIKIEAFSNSGTGSIADGVGDEGFLFTYTWVMIIDDERNITPQLKQITRDNGKLRLDWEIYKGTDFKKYVIQKSPDRNFWNTVGEVYDPQTLSIFDPSYIGESEIYQILTFANGTYYSREVSFQDTIPQLISENLGDKSFKLTWKPYFTDNIAGYIISSRAENDEQGYKQVATLPPSATSYIYQNGKFGTITDLMLTIIPKDAPSYFSDEFYQSYYYSTKCNDTIGEKSFTSGIVYVPYGDFLIYRTANTIFFYDYNTREKIDSLVFSNPFNIASVSPNGNYILGYENDTNFFLYDFSDKTKKTVGFSQITGSLKDFYNMAISNVGIAVLAADRDYFIYDFINNNLIASRNDFDYLPLNLTISADGKYFSNGYNYFFKTEGNAIQQLPDINDLYYFGFNPGNPEEVIEYTPNGSLKFINIVDRSISKSLPISCDVIQNIDFNSGKILGTTRNDFKVYDLSTGNILWTYPTFSQTNAVYFEFQLCKDAIYWYEGYLIYTE